MRNHILIVNMIIDGRSADATRAEFQRLPSQFNMESDGFIGAVQMTLAHGPNFSINLTNDAMAADYKTSGNHTRLVIVAPSSENLFTYSGDFQIVDHMVDNGTWCVGTPDDLIKKIHEISDRSGGFGGFMIQATEWGTRDQVMHSYELIARYVMPHFQGSLSSLQKSQK